MVRRTFGQVKDQLKKYVGRTGVASSDSRIMSYVNDATEELMIDDGADYSCLIGLYAFRIYDQILTLPADLDSVMHIAVGNGHYDLRAPWFEMIENGPGPQSMDRETVSMVAIDRGEATTFRDIPNVTGKTYKLRFYMEGNEYGKANFIVRGLNSDGNYIRSTDSAGDWIDGEEHPFPNPAVAVNMVETTNYFSSISEVIKPVTSNYVQVFTWDGTEELFIGRFAPKETAPSYRRFFIPGIENQTDEWDTVTCRCRKRFIPITDDNDFLIISNVAALRYAVRAQVYFDANDIERGAINMNRAKKILKDETKGYRGNATKPAITFQPRFGIGNFPRL